MIGRIRGILIEKQPGGALIEAGGVGYEVDIPYTTFFRLPDSGHEAVLYTHLAVREDAQQLYGFANKGERELFRLLIRTSGVGPKLALAILSGLEADAFIRVVEDNDVAALVKIPGVGKKTAERLLIEVRDRIRQLENSPVGTPREETVSELPGMEPASSSPMEEAEAALIALGYRPQEADRALQAVAEEGTTSQELIRLALKHMMNR
ncbi:Holliday junction branch migration protein RuvA [Halomonadaceae bacterium KBTZ08]